MKTLSTKEFVKMRKWVLRNGRQLEIARWKYKFENGSKEDILEALSVYQNEDGGFGNILEPDNWNPESSPYTTLFAIIILFDSDLMDIKLPLVQGIVRYLESGVNSREYGWFFSIPSNNNFARAPWDTYDEKANELEGIGVTAGLVNFILNFVDSNTELYKRAYKLLDNLLALLVSGKVGGDLGAGSFSVLRKTINSIDFGGKYDLNQINAMIEKMVNDDIERDTTKWPYYCHTPHNVITAPDSEYYKENEEITKKELDYLLDTINEDGVWNLQWSWFDLVEKYPREWAISENWWKSIKAIELVSFLKNFGRVEGK